jgi:hypothetical protein
MYNSFPASCHASFLKPCFCVWPPTNTSPPCLSSPGKGAQLPMVAPELSTLPGLFSHGRASHACTQRNVIPRTSRRSVPRRVSLRLASIVFSSKHGIVAARPGQATHSAGSYKYSASQRRHPLRLRPTSRGGFGTISGIAGLMPSQGLCPHSLLKPFPRVRLLTNASVSFRCGPLASHTHTHTRAHASVHRAPLHCMSSVSFSRLST